MDDDWGYPIGFPHFRTQKSTVPPASASCRAAAKPSELRGNEKRRPSLRDPSDAGAIECSVTVEPTWSFPGKMGAVSYENGGYP